MDLNRTIALQYKFETQIEDLFSRLKIYHGSAENLSKAMEDIGLQYPKKFPRHAREYLKGYFMAKFHCMQKHDLEFVYIHEGKFYAIDSGKENYWQKHFKGEEIQYMKSATIWKDTDKIYSMHAAMKTN